jgi:hypothetical protein
MFKYVEIMYVFMAKELGFILILTVLMLVYPLDAIAQQGIGSGFAELVGSNKVNDSNNTTIGSGFAESIDVNEYNATINETLNATMIMSSVSAGPGSGFPKSIVINQSINVSGRDFSNMIK